MQELFVETGNFDVTMDEKEKLYNIYGKKYVEELPKIYERLANIFNEDMFFSELVDRRIHNRNCNEECLEELMLHLLTKLYTFDEDTTKKIKSSKSIDKISDKSVLEKIDIVLGNPKEKAYLDALYSISKLLFDGWVYYLLQLYITEKEPALNNCYGVKDTAHCDFLIERYREFARSMSADLTPKAPVIDENGCIVIEKGDLFHGTYYFEETVGSIAKKGLESGQLHGIDEDGETFCCIDFFRATKNSSANEVCSFGKQYTNGNNQVVFVISHSNLEGEEAMFPNITDYDAYNETTEKGRKAREFVNVAGLPLDYSTGAAILMGVPPCMISSIIVNKSIEEDEKKIEFLNTHFPKSHIFSRETGKLIRTPLEMKNDRTL